MEDNVTKRLIKRHARHLYLAVGALQVSQCPYSSRSCWIKDLIGYNRLVIEDLVRSSLRSNIAASPRYLNKSATSGAVVHDNSGHRLVVGNLRLWKRLWQGSIYGASSFVRMDEDELVFGAPEPRVIIE